MSEKMQNPSKLLAKEVGAKTVAGFFDANKAAMIAVLPRHINPDRMLKLALGAIKAVPQLQECSVSSLFGAVVQCSQLGLEPNTPMGHVYLIPFRNKKKNVTEVQVIIGYKGLIDLARRSGQIESISAQAIYQNDEFDFEFGLNEKLRHIPTRGDRGPIIGAYAVAKMKGGGHQFDVMWRDEIDRIVEKTQSQGQYGPWLEYYAEMCRKTAVRRLSKYLPLSTEFARAAEFDRLAAENESQNLGNIFEGETVEETPAHLTQWAADLAAEREAGKTLDECLQLIEAADDLDAKEKAWLRSALK